METKHRHGYRGALVGAVLLAALAVTILAPSSALREAGATSFVDEVGGSYYVGLIGMVDRPVTLLATWPRTEAPAEVSVCRPVAGAAPFMLIPAELLEDHCTALEPAGFGTRLDPNPPEGDAREYLVVHVDTRGFDTVTFCGLRVLYRTGPRVVYQSDAGSSDAVWNAPEEAREAGYDPCSG